jgi:hypothetical protein
MWAKPPIETVASVEEQRSRPARPRVVRRDSCWRARGGAPFRWMGAAIGRPRRRSTLAVAGRRIRRRRRRAGLCSARCAGRRRVLRRSSGRRRGARRRSRTRGRRGRPSAGVHRRAGAPSRGRRIGPPPGGVARCANRSCCRPSTFDAEAPGAAHPGPGERAAGRGERHQRGLQRDGRERVHDQPGGLAARGRRDEGDAGREPGEGVAERARVRCRRGVGWSGERHQWSDGSSPRATWAR